MTKLEDVFILIRNGASIKQGDSAEGFPITRIETIANEVIDRNRMGYAGITELAKYSDYVLKTGDILMSHINSEKHLGKTAIYDNCNNEIIIHGMNLLMLRSNEKVLLPKYAYYYFKSTKFKRQIPKITKNSVNQASFTITDLKEFRLNVPSLEEQKKIAQKLDKASILISLRKKQIEQLDLLVKSRFVEMFGTYLKSKDPVDLIEVSEKITDGEHGTVERVNKGILYLMARNITKDNQLDFSELSYIDRTTHNKIYSRCNPEYDDLMLVCVGATIGKTALVPNMEEFSIARSVALVKYKRELINGRYILWLFNTEYMKRQLKTSSNESAQAGLYIGMINKLKVPVPPIDLQTQFADFVQKVEKQKAKLQAGLEKIELTYKSLMQQYFG